MIVHRFLEFEVNALFIVLFIAQQVPSRLYGRNFDSLFDENFLRIRQMRTLILVLAMVLR